MNSHPCFIFSLFQNDLLSLIFFPRIFHTYRNNQDDQVLYLTPLKLCNNEEIRESFEKHLEFCSSFLEISLTVSHLD